MSATNMTLVSVVVPSYNHSRYIGDALASVYFQSYPRLELIIIDDDSQDQTFELAEMLTKTPEYRRRFKRIVCEKNVSNLGAHKSINLGVSLARGKWISILNSDDTYYPERITKLLEFSAIDNASLVFSGLNFLYDTDISWTDRITIKQISEAQGNADRYPSIREALFHFNFCATTGNMFLRSEIFRALGAFSDLKYCHDWDFIMRAVETSRVSFLPERLYNYRLHGTNSFKALADVGRRESELVARGVKRRSKDTFETELSWNFGTMGLLSDWLGYR
jgi:glycosyltransferase involved in cell wall biosynthesis